MKDLTGKTAVITGASRGIGAAAAAELAAAGANVCLLARSETQIIQLANDIGPRAMARACDVADYAAVDAAIRAAQAAFGSVDILINNAGVIAPISALASVEPQEWSQMIDINLKGVFYGIRAALPIMQAQGAGTILTVSSGAAHHAVEGWSGYCASKAGAAMLTESLHLEHHKDGIRSIGLSPGTVATQMQKDIKASGINPVSQLDWSAHIAADWPAKALVWMCTSAADPYLGTELSLRDTALRQKLGLL